MTLDVHLDRLKEIYAAMDRAYQDLADFYEFDCSGCRQNCCHTYFFHYTHAEYFYLLKGVGTLNGRLRDEAVRRARRMCEPDARSEYLCPLNLDGRCILYPYRTMICRLHGLPYEWRWPDGRVEVGPGCDRFEHQRAERSQPYRRLDRTTSYTDLAHLEARIRRILSAPPPFRKTIAEMIRDGLKA